MVDRPVKPMGVSRRGMAQDSLSSGNLTRALQQQQQQQQTKSEQAQQTGSSGKTPETGKSS